MLIRSGPVDVGGVVRTWGPPLAGLATIPLIIHPIDQAVDFVLDNSLRTLYTNPDAAKEVGSMSLNNHMSTQFEFHSSFAIELLHGTSSEPFFCIY